MSMVHISSPTMKVISPPGFLADHALGRTPCRTWGLSAGADQRAVDRKLYKSILWSRLSTAGQQPYTFLRFRIFVCGKLVRSVHLPQKILPGNCIRDITG
ncbi:unnamed protein product [Amoebophrya sp. A120]|nr:unnamed protein product [Amoebophrya sp. A120]|eukprot:GSA120T00009137001.1